MESVRFADPVVIAGHSRLSARRCRRTRCRAQRPQRPGTQMGATTTPRPPSSFRWTQKSAGRASHMPTPAMIRRITPTRRVRCAGDGRAGDPAMRPRGTTRSKRLGSRWERRLRR